jgi:hypothetical protein
MKIQEEGLKRMDLKVRTQQKVERSGGYKRKRRVTMMIVGKTCHKNGQFGKMKRVL